AQTLDAHPDAVMASACHPIENLAALTNPNVVKVVCDENGYALYFSRAPIPWPREEMAKRASGRLRAWHHIGLYAYRAAFVAQYAAWSPGPLEEAEQLEQLRVL